ncbi:MAG: GbsR/MarR family transcriptional regulator [Ktedonobacterales bacterium]
MPELERLSPALREFIMSMGVYFERYGLSRIGGRILGLLIVVDRPLSLDDMATTLQVSRASISTNMRLITASSLAEQISLPGDRRDYYRFAPDTWERALVTELDGIQRLRRIGERGLAAASASESTAREHLEGLLQFCDLLISDRRKTIARLRALKMSEHVGHVTAVNDANLEQQA